MRSSIHPLLSRLENAIKLVVGAAFFCTLIAANGAAEPIVVVALGDSLTAGLGVGPEEAFPAQLEQALQQAGLDARVINAGASGDTSAGGLARLDWSLGDNPELVIVQLGANDGLRGLDPAATQSNLDAILGRLAERGIKTLLTGMLAPPNLGRDYGDRFNAIYPELATNHGLVLFPFFLQDVAAVQALNQSDGIHPNAAGVSIVVANILPFVLQVLDAELN